MMNGGEEGEGEGAGDEETRKRKRTNEEEKDNDDDDDHKRKKPDEEGAETEKEKEEARKRKRACKVAGGVLDGIAEEEEEKKEDEEEKEGEPPRKQSRPNPGASDPAPPLQAGPLQQQTHYHQHHHHHLQQQQLVKVGDWTVVRCTETRQNILRIVHEYFPSMVDRLVAFHRRSEAHDADRNHCINRARQSPLLFGGLGGQQEKKGLTSKLVELVADSTALRRFREQGGDREYARATAADYDSDLTWSAEELRRLTCRMIQLRQRKLELLEVHNDNEDREQKRTLDEIRIHLYDAVFFDQRMVEPPVEPQDSGPFDLPIRDAWELVKVVCNEVRQAFDYVEELKRWVSAYKDPPTTASAAGPSTTASGAGPSTTASAAGPTPASGAGPTPASGAGPSTTASGAGPTPASGAGLSATATTAAATAANVAEKAIRREALQLCDRLTQFCNETLVGQIEFLMQRSHLAKAAWQKPPSEMDRMSDVNGFEVTQSVEWRRVAFALAEKCERLLEFAERHIRILEQ